MSTIKDGLTKNDFIAPIKEMSDIHFVIKTTLHDIFVRRESDDEVFGIGVKDYNMGMWQKVDPKTVEILYAEMLDSSNKSTDKPTDTSS